MAQTICAANIGMETHLIGVEANYVRGFGEIQLLGNASELCRDGRQRAKAALDSLNIDFPRKRIMLNLTPADLRKDGSQFDLGFAVALAILILGETPKHDPSKVLLAAELGLNGDLKPVRGIVSFGVKALRSGMKTIVAARENYEELQILKRLSSCGDSLEIICLSHLRQVLDWLLHNIGCIAAAQRPQESTQQPSKQADFDDMVLTPEWRLAAMASVAGQHNILLHGSPGSGKSMLAQRLPSLLPTLGKTEHLDCLQINSLYWRSLPRHLIDGHPPFRSPHHQASSAAVMGTTTQPGEMSLAHAGILFLDEMPEFRRDVLESLREPLETGEVHVARSEKRMRWKARILLVAACNNCPCGWFGSKKQTCHCAANTLQSYRKKLSGPILDRIDIHLEMLELPGIDDDISMLFQSQGNTSQTETMREVIAQSLSISRPRNRKLGVLHNVHLKAQDLQVASGLAPQSFKELINKHLGKLTSHRHAVRCVRLARTLADLSMSEEIRECDLEQAVAWRTNPVDQALRGY